MQILDSGGSARMAAFIRMARQMSSAHDPTEVLHAYLCGIRDVSGPETYIRLTTAGLSPGHFRLTRLVTTAEEDEVESPSEWKQYPVQSGGFLGEVTGTLEPKVINGIDIPHDPLLGDALAPYGAALAIPAYYGGEAMQWIVMLHGKGVTLTLADLEEAFVRINMLYSNINTAAFAQELSEATRWIRNEVQTIAEIQQALLPTEIPAIAGLEGEGHYQAYEGSGGDYYDFRPLRMRDGQPDPEGPWAIIVADAAGHGPAAAVLMAILRTLFHCCEEVSMGPGALLEYCNRHLFEAHLHFAFITAFAAIYDPAARTVRYARAGHEPPLLVRRNGSKTMVHLDGVNGFPLGIEPKVESDEAVVTLELGETLLLYTDGVTEARSADDALFGLEGIERALAASNGEARSVIDAVVKALRDHEAGVKPRDDRTFVALRATGPDPAH